MCGICGVVRLDGGSAPAVDAGRLISMTRSLTHRGPDDEGHFIDEGIALGVRRLSIVDIAHGHQPVTNESGDVVAVQNGELYNQDELRAGPLASHTFRTRCDTEILPHAYEEFGPNLAQEIDGEFSFAIWDSRQRRLVLARDRAGVKPLYYAHVANVLVFASELKTMLVSGLVGGELDRDAIAAYLGLGYFPAPATPFVEVRKLLPGHILEASRSGVSVRPYWRFPDVAGHDAEGQDRNAAAHDVASAIARATESRLMGDVPVGMMLSGGLDSTLLLALVARASANPVPTFTVGFRGFPQSELPAAREIARHFRCEHHELELPASLPTDELDDLLWTLDEPIADLSAVGFRALCEFASNHVKVVLSGQGADELFAGYPKHRAAAVIARGGSPLRALASLAVRAPIGTPRALAAAAAPDAASRLVAMSGLPLPDRGSDSLRCAHQAIRDRFPAVPKDPFAATLFLDAQLALPDAMLHYFDRVSMSHSLEVRVPLVDHHVIEVASAISPNLKATARHSKILLREVAEGIVPPEVLRRPKIGFMHQMTAEWVRRQLPSLVAERLSDATSPWRDFVDADDFRFAAEAVSARTAGRGTARFVFAVIALDAWLRSFERRAAGIAAETLELRTA